MSASVTSRSSITKPPSSIRLWAMNWRRKSAIAGPGQATQPVGLEEAPLALARQQRLAVVQLQHELDPVARRLDRVEQPEAGAAGPGRQRPAAEYAVGEHVGQAGGELLRDPERHPEPRVDRAAEGDQRAQALVAPVGGGLVDEHPALRVAAEVHVAAGRLAHPVDGVRDREHVVGERALESALLALRARRSRPPTGRPRARAGSSPRSSPARRRRPRRRASSAGPAGSAGRLGVWRRGSSAAAGRRGARRRPRTATAPRRSRARRSAPPRARSGRRRRSARPDA